MKLKKVSFYFLDFDEVENEEVVDLVENIRYPNSCIHPQQATVEEVDIGEWSDDHRCNYNSYELSREFQGFGFQEHFGICKNCGEKSMLNNYPNRGWCFICQPAKCGECKKLLLYEHRFNEYCENCADYFGHAYNMTIKMEGT